MRAAALVLLLLLLVPVSAQEDEDSPDNVRNHPVYVFLSRGDVQDTLIFVDMLTGEETRIDVRGDRYTPINDEILYFDTFTRRVMLARPDGTLNEHPFIQPGPDSRRVDWVISDDGTRIAWTLTGLDAQDRLTTRTTVANLDGTNSRPVLVDVDEAGTQLRALPVAFSADNQTLYMDNHPDGISAFTAFDQYVGLFALDLSSGATALLPGESGSSCICGAALLNATFVRLRLRFTSQTTGFDVHIYDLARDSETVIPALDAGQYDTGGDVLISPDGSQAVYALAQVQDFGTPSQSIETIFVRVDLAQLTQETLTPRSITTFVRPVAWTEDNSAVIFTSPDQDGTWKIDIADGRLERIANATYLGVLRVN